MVAMVAASALARGDTPEYAGAVLDRLDRFAHWRQDFLVAMVASMGESAGPALRAKLADSSASTKARAVAADALAMVSDPLAADLAWTAMQTSDGVELRAASLRVLGSVGRAKHLDAVRACLTSPELGVRLAAVRALGHFGLDSDLASLEEAAKNDSSPWVAIAGARALKAAGGQAALEALAGSDHPRAALGLQVMSEARSW
jgi:HEAT repeat protein